MVGVHEGEAQRINKMTRLQDAEVTVRKGEADAAQSRENSPTEESPETIDEAMQGDQVATREGQEEHNVDQRSTKDSCRHHC